MPDIEDDSISDQNSKFAESVRSRLVSWLAFGLGCFLLLAYRFQWDCLTGLTNIPAFCWLVPALLMLFIARRSSARRLRRAAWCLWLAFLLFCVPETISLTRVLWNGFNVPQRSEQNDTMRIITYNLGDHPARAIEEILPFGPDLILLQEVSSEKICRDLGERVFDEDFTLLYHSGQAILARGEMIAQIDPSVSERFQDHIACRVRMSKEREITLACVHLAPPSVSFNFISPSYWSTQYDIRKKHRTELATVRSKVQELGQDAPIILGGDFNAPSRDGCTSQLSSTLTDAFAGAGVGWGNTGPSQFPLHRVDQIWVSTDFYVDYCAAIATKHSDHRMVLCDVRFRD